MSKQSTMPLTGIEMDDDLVVDGLSDHAVSLLKRLKAHGITPGSRFHVT